MEEVIVTFSFIWIPVIGISPTMLCCQLIFRVCAIGDNWKRTDSEKAVHNHLPSECHFDNTLAGLASMDGPYKAGWH